MVVRDLMFTSANKLYLLLVCRSISCLALDSIIEDGVCSVQLEADCSKLPDCAVLTICWEVRNNPPADLGEGFHVLACFLDVPD